MTVDDNTVKLVRALVKLSSALYDADEIMTSERFKRDLKKDLAKWSAWIEEYIQKPVNSLANADDETLMDLIKMFDSYDKNIYIVDSYTTYINLFLAKVYSAYNDLIALESQYQGYTQDLIGKIHMIKNRGYLKSYTNYVDPDGNSFNSLVEYIDKAGNTIIVGTQ